MTPRFQADADLDYEIVRGLLRREPAIDFRSAQDAFPDALPDPHVLAAAARDDRILVSHDVHTMPGHFARFVQLTGTSPGVVLVRQTVPLGVAIDQLLLIWSASDHREWRDRVSWIPF